MTGEIGGDKFFGGNLKFAEGRTVISEAVRKQAESFASEGKTPLFFGRNEELDRHNRRCRHYKRRQSAGGQRIEKIWGSKVVMLTGDNERTAKAIGEQAGVDEVIAGVLPDGKEDVIKKLKEEEGKVAMVGDRD